MGTNAAEANRRHQARKAGLSTRVKRAETRVVRRALELAVEESPVRTGQYVADWQVSVGSPGTDTGAAPDPTKSRVVDERMAALGDFEPGTPLYVSNPHPGALRMEHGWSDQAPRGVLSVALARLKAELAGR